MHLLLVDLAHIENLVHKRQDTLHVTFYGCQFMRHILSELTFLQLMQRTENQRQRRTYVMSRIDKELHLLFIKLLASTTGIGHKYITCQQ